MTCETDPLLSLNTCKGNYFAKKEKTKSFLFLFRSRASLDIWHNLQLNTHFRHMSIVQNSTLLQRFLIDMMRYSRTKVVIKSFSLLI